MNRFSVLAVPPDHSPSTAFEDGFVSIASVSCCVHRIPPFFADKGICMRFTSGKLLCGVSANGCVVSPHRRSILISSHKAYT